jgi:hypothetical protein
LNGLWHELGAPAIAAAIGTLAGATLAFWFDRHNRAVRIEDQRVTATNTAIFSLARMWNDLDAYRRDHIEEQRAKQDRWITLRPTSLPKPLNFDAASLSYLFELDGDAPNLPMEVDVDIGKYASIYETAVIRNRIHENEAQPAIETARLGMPSVRPRHEQIMKVLGGTRVIDTLQGLTDDLIFMIDDALESIPKTAAKLRAVGKATYPKRKIIGFAGIPHPTANASS